MRLDVVILLSQKLEIENLISFCYNHKRIEGFTMDEKVILVTPSGEKLEKKLVCYFKSTDDEHPNIKNIPIVAIETGEMNGANYVLEFFWEQNGIYQPVNNEAAWGEVKKTIIDIINGKTEVEGVL